MSPVLLQSFLTFLGFFFLSSICSNNNSISRGYCVEVTKSVRFVHGLAHVRAMVGGLFHFC